MRFIWLFALVLLTGVAGCGGGGGGGGTVTPITVGVVPDVVPLTTGESQQFTADVVGTTNQGVTWSVVEGNSGGTITVDGLYKAPPTAGTDHVQAISKAKGSAVGTAVINVTVPAAQTGNIQGTIQ